MVGGNVDTDTMKPGTAKEPPVSSFLLSDSTRDCHAMRKSFHSPTVSFPPDPEEFVEVFLTTTGSAVLTQ